VEGKHFTRSENGISEISDLGRKEVAYTYGFLYMKVLRDNGRA
jgi:putative aldouronate transport system substrate-binding protein